MLSKQMKLKYYDFRSAAHEYQRDQWVLMKNNWNQFEGPFQIVKIKPHNTVEIKMHEKTNIFAHVKNLKPYHLIYKFSNFSSQFAKTRGWCKLFWWPGRQRKAWKIWHEKHTEDTETKIRVQRWKRPDRRRDASDSEDDDFQKPFPNNRKMERKYLFRDEKQDKEIQTDMASETEAQNMRKWIQLR